jgi:serine/threonine protein kinase
MGPRYELKRLLGRGGMAEVYEATQRGEGAFERRVAVKRLLPDAAQNDSLRRSFLDEASIAARLHHASIVSVLDFGILDGQAFQVLELVVGADLSALLRAVREAGSTFPEALALYVCREVAHALHYAHGLSAEGRPLGIVHRDVKPSNVLVSAAGEVKLTDFGIAFANERSERTQTGVVKGTMSYMAPEQLMGGRVDARADVFSLGCMLHALLNGQSPLTDPSVVALLVAGGTLPLSPSITPDIAQVIQRATHGLREQRYPTAGAMAHALTELLSTRSLPDGKQALAALMTDHQPPDTVRQPLGALDGMFIVPSALSDGDGARTYVTKPTRIEPLAPPSPSLVRASRRSRTPLVIAATVVLGLSCVAAAVGVLRARSGSVAATPMVSSASVPSGVPSGLSSPSVPSASAALFAPALQSANATTVASTRPPTPLHATVRPSTSAPSTARAPTQVEPAPTEQGVIAVGAPSDDRGAQVLVDGVPRGVAPKQIVLSAGVHTVTLRRSDGRTLGPIAVTVRGEHTSRAPLRVPAPE